MAKKMCLVCGTISDESRCPKHRTRQARGYNKEHYEAKNRAMKIAPYCWKCGCPVTICKLEWHHVEPLQGGRNSDSDERRQLLCKRCHDSVKENQMAAQNAGGLKITPPGGLQENRPGGIDANNWRVIQGHVSVDPFGPLSSSGARVNQVRGVRNPRKDAKTTGFTYAWTLPTVPGGSTATVNNGSTATANFTPDLAGTYVFRCVTTFTGSGKTVTTNFTYVSA